MDEIDNVTRLISDTKDHYRFLDYVGHTPSRGVGDGTNAVPLRIGLGSDYELTILSRTTNGLASVTPSSRVRVEESHGLPSTSLNAFTTVVFRVK